MKDEVIMLVVTLYFCGGLVEAMVWYMVTPTAALLVIMHTPQVPFPATTRFEPSV